MWPYLTIQPFILLNHIETPNFKRLTTLQYYAIAVTEVSTTIALYRMAHFVFRIAGKQWFANGKEK